MLNGPSSTNGSRATSSVEEPPVRAHQHHPTERRRARREDEGDPEHELETAGVGDVGPGEDQGDGDGDREAEDRLEEPDDPRVPDRVEQARVRPGVDPVAEPPDRVTDEEQRVLVEAQDEQQHDRIDEVGGQDDDARRHHEVHHAGLAHAAAGAELGPAHLSIVILGLGRQRRHRAGEVAPSSERPFHVMLASDSWRVKEFLCGGDRRATPG